MTQELLLNLRSGVLHRYPAYESCNVDAIPLQHRLRLEDGDPVPKGKLLRYCRRCLPAESNA